MTTNNTPNPANVSLNNNVTPRNPAIPSKARQVKTDDKGNAVGAVITGTATAAGALLGAMGGGFVANAINSHNNPDEVEVVDINPVPEPEPIPAPTPDPQPIPNPTPAPALEPQPQPQPQPQPGPTPNSDSEVTIVSYDRITNDDGQEMDLLIMQIGDEEVGVLDVNLDGVADVLIGDFNGDGEVDQTEAIVLEQQDVAMADLIAAGSGASIEQGEDVTYVSDDQDYNNNADVNDFFA